MPTNDYSAIYDAIGDRIEAYVDGVAPWPSVASIIAGRIYEEAPPRAAAKPYVVLRIENDVSGGPRGIRTTADVVLTAYDVGFKNIPRLRRLADLIDKAMLQFTDAGDGLLWVTGGRQRSPLPIGGEGPDAETIAERLVFPAVLWSSYLGTVAVP